VLPESIDNSPFTRAEQAEIANRLDEIVRLARDQQQLSLRDEQVAAIAQTWDECGCLPVRHKAVTPGSRQFRGCALDEVPKRLNVRGAEVTVEDHRHRAGLPEDDQVDTNCDGQPGDRGREAHLVGR